MSNLKLPALMKLFSLAAGLLCLSAGSAPGKTLPLPGISVPENVHPRLGRVAVSPDQLIRNALARLKAKDTLGLVLMGPDPVQLMDVYRKIPEGKAKGEGQLGFLQEFYYRDNGKLLDRSMGNYGGKNLELVSWKPTLPPVPVDGGGKILRDIEIKVMDWTTKTEMRIFFVQSIYVDPEGCKIWGFAEKKGK